MSEPDPAHLFAGGGEMGARMRAYDWTASPLGPVASWPQSLRTCVRIVLTSRQPMFVWWGDDLINLYNDAYKSIVGGKHPLALGQPASVVWREIWDQVEPRAQAAQRGNEGTYDEALLLIMERNGYPEETYYTFSYSPVPNDEGGTGGILCANTDDTRRIIGERRLRLLRELAARTSEARVEQDLCSAIEGALGTEPKDLPFALLYLVDRESGGFTLACASGVAAGSAVAPKTIAKDDASTWALGPTLAAEAARLDEGIAARFGELPTGGWPKSPRSAILLPISPGAANGRGGILVVGLNPFLPFDDAYRSFLDLLIGQIAAGIASVEAYASERRRAEALAELDRAKTTFFSNVSHEFRTPLTLMLAPIEDLLARMPDGATRESVRLLHRNTLRLLKLVNTLLDFSRIEAGRAQAVFEPTDLAASTRDLASSFRAATDRAGVDLVVDTRALREPAWVDRDMWEKIVLNLVSNAFKFTFEGAITVRLRDTDDAFVLEVADTGTGIAEDELPRVFERFHRVEGARSRSHEGSGIGLALVQELVRMHGGTVDVKSKVGEGTTFTVRIPRGSAHLPQERVRAETTLAKTTLGAAPYVEEALRWTADQSEQGPALSEDTGERPSPNAATIFVVDDNADMRAYLTRLLGRRWHVRAHPNGATAFEAAVASPPDVVVTDVMMPVLDGFGLLAKLRGDPRTRAVPIIMLSARAGEHARVEGVEAGADDYIVKPFSARELVARVGAQIDLARLRGVAENERSKLRSLFEKAPANITIVRGPDLVFEFANDSWLGSMHKRYDDVIGRPMREVTGSDEARLERFKTVMRTGERIVRKDSAAMVDGEERFFDFVLEPLRDSAGEIEGVMTFGFDVTDSVRARQRIEAARADAEAANRAKDEFLAMLGHELRNPLAPILTALQLLRMRGDDGIQREREVLERQVRHLTGLVEDLLDVSRVTRGKIVLHRSRVDVATVIAKAVEMAGPLIEERGHHLTVDAPQGLAVDGDTTRLAQIVSNLLTNAAKYTPPGGHIAVRAAVEDGRAVIRVRDDGEGIPPSLLPHIFDLFVQGGRSIDRAAGGLGLGLAIVKSLVGLHGGSVDAHSEGAGRGSELVVRLPQVATEPAAARADDPRAAAPATTAGHRVLVVDDNIDAADLLAEALSAYGCTTEIAYDGPSALEAAERFKPAVMFLDIGLPVMDGYELARRLRANAELRDARLIAVTGYGQESDRERSRAAGFDAHVVKPIDIERLPELLSPSSSPTRATPS